MPAPQEISSNLHFRTLLNGHKYLIADFYATWCPPCKTIAPIFTQLSTQHSVPGKLGFVKINVDEQREVAAPYGITSIPTFIVFEDGKVKEVLKGPSVPMLKGAVERVGREVKKGEEVKEKKEDVKVEGKKEEVKVEGEGKKDVVEEKTVSGSYGMTGGNNWKMSLN